MMKSPLSLRIKAGGLATTGLSLAVAQSTLMHETAGSTHAEIDSLAIVSSRQAVHIKSTEATNQTHKLVIGNDEDWDEAPKQRFGVLSRKFALDQLNQAEANEYENLKLQRRRENPSRSFEQIKADIELHRAVQAAIAGLQQLIDHGTRTFRAET